MKEYDMPDYAERVARIQSSVPKTNQAPALPKPMSEILKDFGLGTATTQNQDEAYLRVFMNLVATKIELRKP